MGTCKWAKEKAQKIKCHPKSLGVQDPQSAARLEDRLDYRGQRTFYFQKAGRILIPVCVIKQRLGCVIFGSGGVAEEVQPWGGWGVVWQEMDRHRGRLQGQVGRASGRLEHSEVIVHFGEGALFGRKIIQQWLC